MSGLIASCTCIIVPKIFLIHKEFLQSHCIDEIFISELMVLVFMQEAVY